MADDDLADPSSLTRASPRPGRRARHAGRRDPRPGRARRHAALRRGSQGGKHPPRLCRRLGRFLSLGRRAGGEPLPCPPGLLCGYLASLADAGLRASTITRRAAAIAHQHRATGRDPPTASPAVREVLRGIRHTRGTAPARKTPATAELIARMLAVCPETLIGRRDRALIALGFAGAFRRSELLALQIADLTESPEGLRVLIRRSKTDQAGEGQEIAIPRGTQLRPVETLQAWLAAAAISEGPVFRPVTKGGIIGALPLGADGFVRALKHRAATAGLDPASFAGHSLRAGFLTSAADPGRMHSKWPRCRATDPSTRCAATSPRQPVQGPCRAGFL